MGSKPRRTDHGRITVFSSTCCNGCAICVGYEEIGSSKWLENATCRRAKEDCAIEMALSHVVHIDSIDDSTG